MRFNKFEVFILVIVCVSQWMHFGESKGLRLEAPEPIDAHEIHDYPGITEDIVM